MIIEQSDSVDFSLEVVPESLRSVQADEGSSGGEVIHTVDLSGRADSRWRKSFCFVQWDCLEYSSFRLSDDGSSISFSLNAHDYPEETLYMVNVLKTILGEVNRKASVPLFTERMGLTGMRAAAAG